MYKLGLILAAGLAFAMPAQAALQARDLNNDSIADAYYDTVLDITWLKDANLAASNTFGLTYNTPLGDHPSDSWAASYDETIDTSGLMTWGGALHWIDAMNTANYLGYSDWRLPTMVDTGGSGCDFAFSGTDCGLNVQTVSGGQVYSELAYMYYVNLDNIGSFDSFGQEQAGWGLVDDTNNPNDESLFGSLQPYMYWSGVEETNNSSRAWSFGMLDGSQYTDRKTYGRYAWAVRPGDVVAAPVPEADTYALMALGMGVVGFLARRKGASDGL